MDDARDPDSVRPDDETDDEIDDEAGGETEESGEFDPDLAGDASDADAPPRPRRPKTGGAAIGAAMMGLHQIFYGPTKEEIVIQVEASGDPPNLDTDGLDASLGEHHRLVGPPLDAIKNRATRRRKIRRR